MKYIKDTKTMLYKSKLKGSFGRIYPISMLILYILSMIEVYIRWQLQSSGHDILLVPSVSIILMGLFFIVMGFIQFYRYRLWVNVIIGLLFGVGSILAIFVFSDTAHFFKIIYIVNALLVILLIIVTWPVLSGQERYESNARRLFKLASEHILETSNGFTERPFAAGKININQDDLLGFARFINGKYIARSIYTNDIIYLVFSLNKSVLKVIQPSEVSYLEINKDGNISVRISEKDYQRYRATFNFDQLCEKMSGVFIRFIEYYKNGNESRIISELKTAR